MLSAPGFNDEACSRVLYHFEVISDILRGTCKEGICIVKARQDKGAHKCCGCFNRQKMSNGADPADLVIGRSSCVQYMFFHRQVTCNCDTKVFDRT